MFTFRQRLPGGGTQVIRDRDSSRLVAKVIVFRKSRNIVPIDQGTVYNDVYDQLRRVPQPKPKAPRLTLRGALEATKAAVKGSAGKIVSQVEISRRAKICKACPRLQPIGGCTG